MERVTICTSWDGKDYYSAEYVNKLFNSCRRNINMPFDFVLFAGPDVKETLLHDKIFIVQTRRSYWWPAMFFWMKHPPGVQTKTKLFIDLDVVIVSPLDTLINYQSEHCYSRDWQGNTIPKGREDDVNSGISLIRNGADSYVWDEYVKAGMPNWSPLEKTPGHKILRMAVQGIINSKKCSYDLFPENICASYKYTVKNRGLPKDCVTVHFHGRPKQHEAKDEWIKEHWR